MAGRVIHAIAERRIPATHRREWRETADEALVSAPRITLIPLGEQHLAATLTWVNDSEMMRLLGRVASVDPAEHRRWFERLASRTDCRYFAVEAVDSSHHVGNIWLWNIEPDHRRAEVRVLFGEAAGRDRGLGSEAIGLLAATAFGSLDLHRLYAYVLAINPRARRAFEKAGFHLEGVLRGDRWTGEDYVDVHLLGRLKSDPPVSEAPASRSS
jgi:RimJ/RimL family protein N-acetyltransferase